MELYSGDLKKMTELQAKIYELLKEIDTICRENDIEYYLAGGTLLGAIRHEGFLPWDDDADILMTRDNWKKFVKLYRKGGLPQNRVLVGCDINRDYPNVFGRYVDITTTAIHTNQLLDQEPAGALIDVFALDPIPENPVLQRKYLEDMMLYSDLVNISAQYSYRAKMNQSRYPRYKSLEDRGLRVPVRWKLERDMFSYKEKDCDYYALRWGGYGAFSRKEIYGHPKDARFEDSLFMIPSRPVDYLIWHYGLDWVQVPPHEERMSHNAVFNMDIDYKTMRRYFSVAYDKEKLKDAHNSRKMTHLVKNDAYYRHLDANVDLKAKLIQAKTKLRLEKEKIDVKQLLNAQNYEKILEVFEEYVDFAPSRDAIGREDFAGLHRFEFPVVVEIGTEDFEAVIDALIHISDLSKADRLLEVRKKTGRSMTPRLVSARSFIDQIKKAESYFGMADWDKAAGIVNTLLKEQSENQYLLKFKIRLLKDRIEKENMTEYFPELKKYVQKARKLYPEDGEIEKYVGDIAILEGRMVEGLQFYYQSSKHSDNGCIALDIRRYLRTHVDEVKKAFLEIELPYEERKVFFDYICEQAGNPPELVVMRYQELNRQVDSTNNAISERLVLLDELNKSVLYGQKEAEIIAEEIYISLGIQEEDKSRRMEFLRNKMADKIGDYIQKKIGENLTATEYKLLGDSFCMLHNFEKGFEAYRKAWDLTDDSFVCREISEIFNKEVRKIQEDFALGHYPETVLLHGWRKRFGEKYGRFTEYDMSIINGIEGNI
ncbi:MAG: LicD family protein [Clostridiales bacterium]|nr:LicD family protein [Clostridiales bacterium]